MNLICKQTKTSLTNKYDQHLLYYLYVCIMSMTLKFSRVSTDLSSSIVKQHLLQQARTFAANIVADLLICSASTDCRGGAWVGIDSKKLANIIN